MTNPASKYILTPEQFKFLRQYHERIVQQYINIEIGVDDNFLKNLLNSPEYKALFGDMDWDDVYDRFEDTRGYDPSIKEAALAELREKVRLGIVKLHHRRKSDVINQEDD